MEISNSLIHIFLSIVFKQPIKHYRLLTIKYNLLCFHQSPRQHPLSRNYFWNSCINCVVTHRCFYLEGNGRLLNYIFNRFYNDFTCHMLERLFSFRKQLPNYSETLSDSTPTRIWPINKSCPWPLTHKNTGFARVFYRQYIFESLILAVHYHDYCITNCILDNIKCHKLLTYE